MKIFIHTMYFLPEFGSAPILMDELAAGLSARGHNVEVLTTIPRPPHRGPYRGMLFARENRNGYRVKRYLTNTTVHHIGRLVAWSIYTLFTMMHLFRVHKKDVLFLRLPPLQLGVTGILARKWKGAKILLNVQDIHPDLSIESGLLRNPRAVRWAQAFEKWIYRHSDNILVISEGFKRNLLEKGVDPLKIKIIPNWVDTDLIRPLSKNNAFAAKHGLDEKFVIMYSGTISISSIKTLEHILAAAKQLQAETDILFVIVGEGLKKAELKEKAQSMKLDNVLFLPFQPYCDLPFLLASSDLLLVPLDKEKSLLSVPSKLYNFMAAGRPIFGLAHKDSEVKNLISKTGCGICVPPDDVERIVSSIQGIKDDEKNLSNMASSARKYAVEHYSKTRVLEKLEKLIASLV